MEKQELRTFGRRHGKKISNRKILLMDTILPTILPTENNVDINPILEIGFGNGEHLKHLASLYKQQIIIGAEPFVNGVAALLSSITDKQTNQLLDQYKNIRIYPDDVRLLLKSPNCKNVIFSQIWILHPDPWPKAKHEKRRLLNSIFLTTLSEHMNQDSRIIIGTDHWGYYDWIINQLLNTNLKIISTKTEIIQTKYQEKNKANTDMPKYLILGIN